MYLDACVLGKRKERDRHRPDVREYVRSPFLLLHSIVEKESKRYSFDKKTKTPQLFWHTQSVCALNTKEIFYPVDYRIRQCPSFPIFLDSLALDDTDIFFCYFSCSLTFFLLFNFNIVTINHILFLSRYREIDLGTHNKFVFFCFSKIYDSFL